MNIQNLPEPGTKFRAKAGCDAAYRAGDKTAASFEGMGCPIIWTFARILPPEHRYAGQYELDGPAGKGWLVVGPNWLEPVEEPKSEPRVHFGGEPLRSGTDLEIGDEVCGNSKSPRRKGQSGRIVGFAVAIVEWSD